MSPLHDIADHAESLLTSLRLILTSPATSADELHLTQEVARELATALDGIAAPCTALMARRFR